MMCHICKSTSMELVYSSQSGSLSSICEIHDNNIYVYICKKCLHVSTEFNIEHEEYYDEGYNILMQDEDEDQLYSVEEDGTKIYRTEHQLNLLMNKIDITSNTKILDYGCAKSSTMKALSSKINILPYLFDVSRNYKKFWDFTNEDHCAMYDTPSNWDEAFSVVTSFYSLEHILSPEGSIQKINKLLKNDGYFFFIVPNILVNIGDMLVNEHPNHFTESSIKYILENNGFAVKDIDFESYFGAIVVVAQKSKSNTHYKLENIQLYEDITKLGKYWLNINEKINQIEDKIKFKKFAIYGSGFYGSFIYSQLKNKVALECFIDQNPHRQKTKLFGVNIIAPENLPESVEHIIIGLNPKSANNIMSKLGCLNGKSHYYLKD